MSSESTKFETKPPKNNEQDDKKDDEKQKWQKSRDEIKEDVGKEDSNDSGSLEEKSEESHQARMLAAFKANNPEDPHKTSNYLCGACREPLKTLKEFYSHVKQSHSQVKSNSPSMNESIEGEKLFQDLLKITK